MTIETERDKLAQALDAAIHVINLLRRPDRDPTALMLAEKDFDQLLEQLREPQGSEEANG